MNILPPEFLRAPIAHRGLHNLDEGIPENSAAAFRAAIEAGYGIELDVQLTADDQPVVFHDYDLSRLTREKGDVRDRSVADLGTTPLNGGSESIPSLAEVLDLVAGQVPVLIEIKDQDRGLGPNVGELESAVAEVVKEYQGPIAVMSFNPNSVARMASVAPNLPRGLVTCDYTAEDWPNLPKMTLRRLRKIPDYALLNACFVSHQARDLDNPRIAQLKSKGAAILCWTIRSPEEETEARKFADNITFEGYEAPLT